MKILVIRFSSIGDIVLTSPVLRCLKTQLPGVEIYFATKWKFREVTIANPYIDKFIYLKDDMPGFVKECSAGNFDAVVDLQHNFRSYQVKRAIKAPSYSVNKLNLEKFLFTKLKMDVMPEAHFAARCLETVAPLGVSDDGKGLDHFIGEANEVKPQDIPVSHSAGYVALVIGATYHTKRMPVDQLKELARQIRYPVMLIGGPDEKETGASIAQTDPVRIYNACGKFSLNESADLVKRSHLVIAHDTGLMHIAAAFKKPIIVIWGNTDPRLGMYPFYGKASQQVYWNAEVNIWCRPCSKIGYDKCPLGHFKCMRKQDIPTIANTVHGYLGIL